MRSIFLVVLILALINVGCVAPSGYGTTAGGSNAIAVAPGGGSSIGITAGNQHHANCGHKQVGSSDRWPLWVAAGIVLTAVVIVDLLILPFTYHDPFPACRGVVEWCY